MKPRYLLCCLCFISIAILPAKVRAQVNKQDSLALVDLYNNTNGPGWPYQNNWLTTNPLSTWFGITVINKRVTEIDLFANFMKGTLPSSLGNVVKLTLLDLSFNQLNGSMPASLGNLINLSSLNLSSNQFSGGIPASLGNLTKLNKLDLSVNQLSGSIPSTFGNLLSLKQLFLLNNQLSGSIPASLGSLVNLKTLLLYDNRLSGNIPAELGKLENLEGFYAYNNRLKGNIPPELGNLSKLKYLYLNNNRLSGKIPAALSKIHRLYWLYLDHNQLSGGIPASLGNLTHLNYLDLSGNQLAGSIPESLGNLGNLEGLNISHNNFTFDGMEALAQKIPFAVYDHQKHIPVHRNNNSLSVSAGGTLSNNTYRWFRLQGGYEKLIGDSVFYPVQNAIYYVRVGNSIATGLLLRSDTITYTAPLAADKPVNNSADNLHAENASNNFSVYPNPAKNILYVQTDNKASFSLISSDGRLLLTQTISGKGSINVSGITAGLYYLKNDNNSKLQKIIIAK